MKKIDLNFFFKNHAFFAGVTPHEKRLLENVMFKVPNKIIKKQNDKVIEDSIYFVFKGELKVYYLYVDGKKEWIKTIQAGDAWFGGEVLEGQENISEICLEVSDTSKIRAIRISDLYYQISYKRIFRKIQDNIGVRTAFFSGNYEKNFTHLGVLSEKELQRRVIGTQYFVVTLLYAICAYIFFLTTAEAIITFLKASAPITLSFLCVAIFLAVWGIRRGHIPFSVIGLTLTNTKVAVKEGLISLIPILSVALLVKYLAIKFIPQFHQLELLGIQNTINSMGGIKAYITAIVVYIFVTAPLQEFIFRGGIQGCLQQIFLGQHNMWVPILIANLIFATLHIMISPAATMVVFLPGLYWGWLYARNNNLIGVSLSHGISGAVVFYVIGYYSLIGT